MGGWKWSYLSKWRNKCLFFKRCRGWKPEIKMSTDLESADTYFLVHMWLSFHGILTWQKRDIWGLLYKNTNHINGGFTWWPDHLPKPPPPNTINLGVSHSTHEIWENTFRPYQMLRQYLCAGLHFIGCIVSPFMTMWNAHVGDAAQSQV